jgi:hypothetical protein
MPEMGRPCSVCGHPKLEEINKLLLDKPNFSTLSAIFGIGRKSLKNHLLEHIPEELLKSQDAKEALQADNTFGEYQAAKARIEALQTRTYELLGKAEVAENHNACVGYIRETRGQEGELREQRKLLAELEGKLATQPQITIINNPQWVELRTLIITALEPYPEAREAVVHVIRE